MPDMMAMNRAYPVPERDGLWREAFAFETKQEDESSRVVRFVGSTEDVDRDGDVIQVSGWDLRPFKKNPVVLWSHDYRIPAIGKAIRVEKVEGKLTFDVEFAKREEHELADTIFRLVKGGFLRATSVGFIPKEIADRTDEEGEKLASGRLFKKQELLELSIVNVPSNPHALEEAYAKGIVTHAEMAELDALLRGPVPYTQNPVTGEDEAWDGAAARGRLVRWAGGPDPDEIDWAKLAKGFAWFDSESRETLGAYKLPHHDVRAGQLVSHRRGVIAAMVAHLGGRGGTDIPEGDRRPVYAHLAKEYAHHGMEPPEFRLLALHEQVRMLTDAGFAGQQTLQFLGASPENSGVTTEEERHQDLESMRRRIEDKICGVFGSETEKVRAELRDLTSRFILLDDGFRELAAEIREGKFPDPVCANEDPPEVRALWRRIEQSVRELRDLTHQKDGNT